MPGCVGPSQSISLGRRVERGGRRAASALAEGGFAALGDRTKSAIPSERAAGHRDRPAREPGTRRVVPSYGECTWLAVSLTE